MHVWEGWIACTVVMIVVHCIMIILTCYYIWYLVGDFPIYRRIHYSKWYCICLIGWMLAESGVAIFQYSWYGINTCRLAFNCIEFMFWILHTCYTIITIVGYLSLRRQDILELFAERPYFDMNSMNSQMQLMPAMGTLDTYQQEQLKAMQDQELQQQQLEATGSYGIREPPRFSDVDMDTV